MRRFIAVITFVTVIGALAPAGWATAQTADTDGVTVAARQSADVPGLASAREQPQAFGGLIQVTTIHAAEWTPYHDTDNPSYAGYGYDYPSQLSESYYRTQLNLPIGATVFAVYAFVYDGSSDTDWTFSLMGFEAVVSGSPPSPVDYGSVSTSGTPSYTTLILDAGELIIRSFTDLDGDGHENPVAYLVRLKCGIPYVRDLVRFWGAEVVWARAVSPAPASATFSDVPTGHWAFRHIEALADSGITAGCGGGNYCPESPVTRAQMAVLLAKALGLHWPD